MTKQFIFVRHGQSKANAEGIIADGLSPLTEAGIEQARKTALEVQNLGITTIVCSPYLRAQQTAETIAGELGIDLAHIKVIDELHERGLGDQENQPKAYPSEWYSQSDENPTLESRQALLDRMNLAIEKIETIETPGLVLVVGHAVAGSFLFEAAKGVKTLSEISGDNQIGNADFIRVDIL